MWSRSRTIFLDKFWEQAACTCCSGFIHGSRELHEAGDLFLWRVQCFILGPRLHLCTGSHTPLIGFLVIFFHNAGTLYNVYYVEI